MIESLLAKLAKLPLLVIYLVIGAGAAVENFIPPIPADTFVLLGAFLAAGGHGNPFVVFFVTWICNIASAVIVYFISYHYGQSFFKKPIGHWLINEKQMKQIGGFYEKWGIPAIFFSRFLPTFRAMVPVFAGVTHVNFFKVFIPMTLASGVWYAFVVYVGASFGKNWDAVMAFFNRFSTILLIVASVLVGAFIFWWIRSRREKKG